MPRRIGLGGGSSRLGRGVLELFGLFRPNGRRVFLPSFVFLSHKRPGACRSRPLARQPGRPREQPEPNPAGLEGCAGPWGADLPPLAEASPGPFFFFFFFPFFASFPVRIQATSPPGCRESGFHEFHERSWPEVAVGTLGSRYREEWGGERERKKKRRIFALVSGLETWKDAGRSTALAPELSR